MLTIYNYYGVNLKEYIKHMNLEKNREELKELVEECYDTYNIDSYKYMFKTNVPFYLEEVDNYTLEQCQALLQQSRQSQTNAQILQPRAVQKQVIDIYEHFIDLTVSMDKNKYFIWGDSDGNTIIDFYQIPTYDDLGTKIN